MLRAVGRSAWFLPELTGFESLAKRDTTSERILVHDEELALGAAVRRMHAGPERAAVCFDDRNGVPRGRSAGLRILRLRRARSSCGSGVHVPGDAVVLRVSRLLGTVRSLGTAERVHRRARVLRRLRFVVRPRPRTERWIPNLAELVRFQPGARFRARTRPSPPKARDRVQFPAEPPWPVKTAGAVIGLSHRHQRVRFPHGLPCCTSSSSGYSESGPSPRGHRRWLHRPGKVYKPGKVSDAALHLIPIEYVALCELTLVSARFVFLGHEVDGCPHPSRKRARRVKAWPGSSPGWPAMGSRPARCWCRPLPG